VELARKEVPRHGPKRQSSASLPMLFRSLAVAILAFACAKPVARDSTAGAEQLDDPFWCAGPSGDCSIVDSTSPLFVSEPIAHIKYTRRRLCDSARATHRWCLLYLQSRPCARRGAVHSPVAQRAASSRLCKRTRSTRISLTRSGAPDQVATVPSPIVRRHRSCMDHSHILTPHTGTQGQRKRRSVALTATCVVCVGRCPQSLACARRGAVPTRARCRKGSVIGTTRHIADDTHAENRV
jgi:hypothetical protein